MKGKTTNNGSSRSESGQMILLAGFLLAIILLSLAVVVGSGFFSQGTTDGGGISGLTAEVSDQVETAFDAGETATDETNRRGLELGNKTDEANETIEQFCVDESVVAEEVGDDQVILDIECLGVTDRSWIAGQRGEGLIPGAAIFEGTLLNDTITGSFEGFFEAEGRPPADVVFALDQSGSMAFDHRYVRGHHVSDTQTCGDNWEPECERVNNHVLGKEYNWLLTNERESSDNPPRWKPPYHPVDDPRSHTVASEDPHYTERHEGQKELDCSLSDRPEFSTGEPFPMHWCGPSENSYTANSFDRGDTLHNETGLVPESALDGQSWLDDSFPDSSDPVGEHVYYYNPDDGVHDMAEVISEIGGGSGSNPGNIPGPGDSVRINFQPDTSSTPSGFEADVGQVFGDREYDLTPGVGGGQSLDYGWEFAHDEMRERGAWNTDLEDDTLNHFVTDPAEEYDSSSHAYWEIEVPDADATYSVTIRAGDPDHTDSEHSFEVEGTTFQDPENDGGTSRSSNFVTHIGDVDVSGDTLRIEPSDGAYNPKINWVEIEPPGQVDGDYIIQDTNDNQHFADEDDLYYVEYKWFTPQRHYLTQIETINTIGVLNDSDRIGLVEYDQSANVLENLEFAIDNGDEANQTVSELLAQGGTDTSSGMESAVDVMNSAEFTARGLRIDRLFIPLPPIENGDSNGVLEIEVNDLELTDDEKEIESITLGGKSMEEPVDDKEELIQAITDEEQPDDVLDDAADELELPNDFELDPGFIVEAFNQDIENIRDQHIIMHTDGFNSNSGDDANTVNEAADANESYNITTHGVALGAAANEELIEDTAEAGGGLNVTSPAEADEIRKIFEELIRAIQGGEGIDIAGGVDLDIGELEVETDATAGVVDELLDYRMNLTEFDNAPPHGGELVLNMTRVNEDEEVEEVIWEKRIDNNPDGGYNLSVWSEVDEDMGGFNSSEGDELPDALDGDAYIDNEDEKIIVEDNLDVTNVEFNLFEDGNGVFRIGGTRIDSAGSTIDMDRVINRTLVEDRYPIALFFDNKANVTGTFNINLRPVGENFTEFDEGEAFDIEGCEDNVCGTDSSQGDHDPYSTVQVHEARFRVTVEGPDGVSEEEITVELDDEQLYPDWVTPP